MLKRISSTDSKVKTTEKLAYGKAVQKRSKSPFSNFLLGYREKQIFFSFIQENKNKVEIMC